MHIFTDRFLNGTLKKDWEAIDRQVRRAEKEVAREVAAHPGIGLLVAAMCGVFLGIWIKRK